ncbi:MAG: hypothetical protein IT342_26645 [Candidatus Melainabacteria bacterium]|nr:hypothetical protein [Candidatus Melainabacteria bacterium]
MKSAYYGPDLMFTSANLAAARLSALENLYCFKQPASSCVPEAEASISVHGQTLGKARHGRKPLGSALVSVAALISKMDEEQPNHWESRSAPTLQLRPLRKPDQALRIFLGKVEKARINREEAEPETAPVVEPDWLEAQTITLDRVPAYEREIRRTAYLLLMKRCGGKRDFVTACDNRFNACTSILAQRAEAVLMAERLLRRVPHGFTVNTVAWTLTTPNTGNTPALFESCRTPQNIKITVQDCQIYQMEQQILKDEPMQQIQSRIPADTSQVSPDNLMHEPERKKEIGVMPRIISGILESAERMPRLNVADLPVNAMSAATTIS